MKQKQKIPASVILFYVISVILLLVFAFQVYYSYDYIGGYDLDFAAEWKAIFSIYFGQCVLPFIGAIITYGIGVILTKLSNMEKATMVTEKEGNDDNAMGEFVNSLKKAKAEKKAKKVEEKADVAKNTAPEERQDKNEKPVAKKEPAKKEPKAKKEKVVEEQKITESKGKVEDNKKAEEAPKDKVGA